MKRPAFQFYPADWTKDLELRSCSLAARGLWMEMLCMAHESERYGHLTINGKPMTDAQIINYVAGASRKILAELENAGVLSRAADGAIYSRRMVRDEEVRNKRAAGGEAGAEHGAKGASHGAKGGRPRKEEGGNKPPLPEETEPPIKPPPSSSSSTSALTSTSKADGEGGGVAWDSATEYPLPKTLTAATWRAWKRHCACKNKPLTGPTEELQLVRLAEHDDPEKVVLDSIHRGRASLPPVGGWPSDAAMDANTKRRTDTVDAIIGARAHERDITGTATRLDRATVQALPVDLREPDGHDVGVG